MKYIIFIVGFISTFVAYADWQQPELSHNLTVLKKAIPAKDFELQDMDEETIRLSDYKGKVVLLNFWATWCPPCIREMPSMERLHQQVGAEGFKVIAINQMEDADQVFAFTGQLEVDPTFEILFDTTSSVSRDYAVRGLPTTYLIDKEGRIRYRAVGGREFDHPEVIKTIEQLMAE
ncbi:MAG: TlpA family protein disulfide reductase [Gammaproteobacteria bacterium]|nr:TlpA family protein disulfide reductase [Gammaproteobacteria bacterium]MBT8133384.1 TlpA family protein disulfide reductase [Gammaproteobacteria bacterium]NNJ49353.1 TlpA family protein disulfide reductase [Gammaproteobacteria bacterium]